MFLDSFLTRAMFSNISVAEITRRHWVNSDERSNCTNKECRRKFSLIDRPHHCRRCGEVFCNPCSKYKRKLSFLAQPDPEGKPYKVLLYSVFTVNILRFLTLYSTLFLFA